MRRAVVAVLALLVAAPAAAAAAAAHDEAAADIARVDRDWLPAMKACDGERLAAPYARDAILIGPAGDVVRGRAAIANFYRAHLNPCPHILGGEMRAAGAASGGPGLRYEWGVARYVVREPSGITTRRGGPYLSVWRRDAAGRWRIVRNVAF
jgi:uncharacterized protein (TIGR02246 family)